MRIIAIDPSVIKAGIAILENYENRIQLISSWQHPLKGSEVSHRLYNLQTTIENIINNYTPTHMVIEETFVCKSFKYSLDAPLKLSMCRGICHSMAGKYNIPVSEINNKKVKLAVCGSGASTKRMIIQKIGTMFNCKPKEDEAFAIGVGVTYLLGVKNEIRN